MMGEQFIEDQQLVGRLTRKAFRYRRQLSVQGSVSRLDRTYWLLGRKQKEALHRYVSATRVSPGQVDGMSTFDGIGVIWVSEDSRAELVEVVA